MDYYKNILIQFTLRIKITLSKLLWHHKLRLFLDYAVKLLITNGQKIKASTAKLLK